MAMLNNQMVYIYVIDNIIKIIINISGWENEDLPRLRRQRSMHELLSAFSPSPGVQTY